jgi:hypothetical protein
MEKAALHDVGRPQGIGPKIGFPSAPNAGDGSDVINHIDSMARSGDRRLILQIPLVLLDLQLVENWVALS